MRGFLTLLDKEWRDVRTIAAAAAAFAGAGLFFITANFRSSEYPAIAAQYVLPALAALFVAMIAADLVAAETQTRRIEASALLPTRLSTVWTSKATVLAATGALFLAWIVLCQAAAFLVMRPEDVVVTFARRVAEETWQLGAVAAAGAATLFFSTVLERGMVSLVLGVATAAGVEWAARPTLQQFIEGFMAGHAATGWCALFVALAFAVAAAAAFTKGRIHCGSRTRRVIVGVVAFVACLLPAPAAFAGWMRWSWLAIEPGDEAARVVWLTPRPDGRFVALHVVKWDRGQSTWRPHAGRTWLVDVESGSLREAAREPAWCTGWDARGSLRVARRLDDGAVEDVRIDPETLAETGRRTVPEPRLYDDAPAKPSWYATRWIEAKGAARGGRTVVTWTERGTRREFDGWAWCGHEPGVVRYMASPTRLVRHDLATGEEHAILEGVRGVGKPLFSGDDKRVLAVVDGEQALFDAETGARLAGPWPTGTTTWPAGARTGRFVQRLRSNPLSAPVAHELVEIDSGRTLDLGVAGDGWTWPPQIAELPDGRMLVLRDDASVDLVGVDLQLVRHLYAPRRTEN